MRPIRHETVYPHPPQRVWRALSDPASLAEWLMPGDFEPRVGHRFELRDRATSGIGALVWGEVLEVDTQRRLVYTWQSAALARPSTVAWQLDALGRGTRVSLEHAGFSGVRGWLARGALDRRWRTELLRVSLPRELERLLATEEPRDAG